jgi:hypothetical protein
MSEIKKTKKQKFIDGGIAVLGVIGAIIVLRAAIALVDLLKNWVF